MTKNTDEFLRNIGFYVSRKIGFPLVVPDTLQLSVTNKCNLKCLSCNVWRQDYDEKRELNLDEIKNILNEASSWGIKELNLCGGEFFLHKEWRGIIEYAKRNGFSTVICSNGTLITEEVVEKLKSLKVDLICISLDSPVKEDQDSLRGAGTYDKILDGIKILNHVYREIKPKIDLILTVSNKNLFQLKEYIDLAHSLSVCNIYLTALVIDNIQLFSKKKTHDLWIENKYFKDLEEIFNGVYEYAKNKGYALNYPSFSLFHKYFRGELKSGEWTCFAGFRRLVVTATGDIQICGEITDSYRKIGSLKKAWYSYRAFKRRMSIRKCNNYCLQDCHARKESSSLRGIMNWKI